MDTILVIRTDATDLWREKLAGISDFAKKTAWRLQVIDARERRPRFRDLVRFWRPIGAVIDASGRSAAELRLNGLGALPRVYLNPAALEPDRRPDFPYVTSDARTIAALAARELLSRPLGTAVFAGPAGKTPWAELRRAEFERIAAIHGMTVRPLPRNGKALAALPRPVGVFAATDALAAEAAVLATRAGLSIPEDVSIIGVDDDTLLCENSEPTLSSIRPDFHRLGFTAALLLELAVRDPGRAQANVTVPPVGTVRRASTRTDTCGDATVAKALEYIRVHACEGIRPEDVAARAGLSLRSLQLRFKAQTGRSVTAHLIDTRLDAACGYLRVGAAKVSAVANFCGWNSDLAFRKAFRKRYGFPPTRLPAEGPTVRTRISPAAKDRRRS